MKKIRVVVADNHGIVRSALVTCLTQKPDMDIVGEVAQLTNLEETIGEIRPDILLLNVNVINPDVIKSVAKLKNQRTRTKILILSTDEHYEHIAPLLQAGAHGCVLQSDTLDTLLRALRAIAGGEMWLSPAVIDVLTSLATPTSNHPPIKLTRRETEVLQLIAAGCNNDEIASTLVIAPQTVKNHVSNIFTKLGVDSRVAAALYAINHHLAVTGSREQAL